jgi:beta-lysine 5,6-aminomutase alpha subunit
MAHLELDDRQIERSRRAAGNIADSVLKFAKKHSTVAIERAVLRLMGVEGADADGVPLVNRVVDMALKEGLLGQGIAVFFGNCLRTIGDPIETARAIVDRKVGFKEGFSDDRAREEAQKALKRGISGIKGAVERRRTLLEKLGEGASRPLLYVIVATGNIYEDVLQAKVAARAGAQVVAIIRSTAQSLLDYVPEGRTTTGFGGTFATQANFRVMRQGLDEVSLELGRYVRQCNYASGLCMPEMAVLGAIERLDVMLNDALYGILFRDINMQRTLVDQAFSRVVSAAGEIIINTGEDNYLTTADALSAAHTVLASNFINEAIAKRCGLRDWQIGLGHAMQMNPLMEDMFVLEVAQAQMIRQIFKDCPTKYMPPTKYMTGNIFRGHVQDAMFALASAMTGQGIHLVGMMTEAMHTPHIHDRFLALEAQGMVMNMARHLGDEIEFKKGGIIERRAQEVLKKAMEMLEQIEKEGLFVALENGRFANVKRAFTGGRGLDGVFKKEDGYFDVIEDLLLEVLKGRNETVGNRG